MEPKTPANVAAQIAADIRIIPVRNTAAVRAVRRRYSAILKQAEPSFILSLSRELIDRHGQRWLAYELIKNHRPTWRHIGEAELEALGQGIDSWDRVDAFARTLSGPAWLAGKISDEVIDRWARSEDLWWRRAALVSTVALNMRSQGGTGDTARTVAVCRLLVGDQEDMVEKAMSWALRELIVHDPEAVRDFLQEHEATLAARVKREVRNKLKTGLKNPRASAGGSQAPG